MVGPAGVPFGVLLRRHRLAAGLTQEALAERARMSPKAVSDLERGPTRTPRLGTVGLLADALALAPDERAALVAAARPTGAGAHPPPAEPASAALPRPLTPIVGRAGVVASLVELLSGGHQLLTLTGPGGVGKTRVAIEVARRATDAFEDGAVFVDLAPLRDPALVLATIARRVGVDEPDGTPLSERLVTALRAKHMMLVLDNFEQVVGAGPDVLALLESCPHVVALVTSRVALRLRGAREYTIAPLVVAQDTDAPEEVVRSPAVELFVDRALAAGADLRLDPATLAAVADICRRLDGLPLAIELAAARARVLAPTALLARLDERLPLLVGGARDLPDRQKTMRDAIAWSDELLQPPVRALFRRICVFAGGCSLDAVDAVCGWGDTPPVVDGVAELVDNSLVRVTGTPSGEGSGAELDAPRVAVLETIREYGLEQLAAAGETDRTRRRHAAYHLALVEEAEEAFDGPEAPAWLGRLDREHDNMRVALLWAREAGAGSTTLRLAAALWRFWHRRGHLSEGRRWAREALEVAAPAEPVEASVRVRLLVGAATLAMDEGAYEEASAHADLAVTLAREQAAPRRLAAALNVRGVLAREHARYPDAARDHEEALSVARLGSDRKGEAEALLGLAQLAMFSGDAPTASTLARESAGAARDAGDAHLLARALFLLAWEASNGRAYEHAEALATEAQTLLADLGGAREYAEVVFLLGTLALFRGDHEGAGRIFEEALALDGRRGDERRMAEDLGGLASAALNLGDLRRARALAEESVGLARRHRDPWATAMSLTLVGHVDLADGDSGRARERFAEAADLFQAIGNLMYLPWCLEGLAGVAAADGRHELAAELLGAGDAVRRKVGVAVPHVHPAGHERTVATVRVALPGDLFDAARALGERRPPDQTIAAALGRI